MLTSAECLRVLGEPIPAREGAFGMILWTVPSHIWFATLPRRLYINTRLVRPLTDALVNVRDRGRQAEVKTWDGCFNIRNKRGGRTYSLHSWGLAIDINAAWNQFGAKPTMSQGLVECFTDAGFDWGGVWSKPDGQHFQLRRLA